jgi:hypothetical protein
MFPIMEGLVGAFLGFGLVGFTGGVEGLGFVGFVFGGALGDFRFAEGLRGEGKFGGDDVKGFRPPLAIIQSKKIIFQLSFSKD